MEPISLNYYGLVALGSFLLTFVLVLLAIKYFPRFGLMDRPRKYGLKRDPIPYYGGLVAFFVFFLATVIFVDFSIQLFGLLAATFLIFLVGFLDDLFDISPMLRLFVQIIAASLLVVSGIGILSIPNPFGGSIDFSFLILYGIPVLGAIFTIVWVVLITNTMNFLDGISGLSSGVTFISALSIFVLSIRPGIHADIISQQPVALMALIFAFVALAFVVFDFPPAKILMGNTGSTFFGFLLAALAIYSGGKVATAALVLGVPILDTGWVIFRRIFEGKKPWHGDTKHLHHRLLYLGLSEKTVLFIYYGLSVLFGALAVLCVSSVQKLFIFIGLFVAMMILISGVLIVSRKKK